MKIVDVAIIGTGPAGGAAANSLANSGLSVVILEKHKLPRPKPCGGLMPKSAEKYIDCDFSSLVSHRISSVLNLNNYTTPKLCSLNHPDFLLVHRPSFDEGLIRKAISDSNGKLELLEYFQVDEIEERPDGVLIRSRTGDLVQSKFLLAGDGASSKAARCLGLKIMDKSAPALDAEIEVTTNLWQREQDRLTFNFFCLPQGYGWIFPKQSPILSCGVGSYDANLNLNNELQKFIANSLPADQIVSIKSQGFPVPVWTQARQIATSRCCLMGDAASLVDPSCGEGIRYALLSGQLAAQRAIELALHTEFDSQGFQLYQQRLYDIILNAFTFKRKFLLLAFLQAPNYYFRQAVSRNFGYAEKLAG